MNDTEKLAGAEKYLKSVRIDVLDRAYSSTNGTADVIAAEKGELVVVAIVPRIPASMPETRKKRLRRVGLDWMDSHGRRYDRLRVDLVRLKLEGTGGYTIEHVRGMG